MHLKKDELTLIFDSQSPRSSQTIAMALTITDKINKQDLHAVDASATLFQMCVEKLGGDVKSLINKADPYYQEHLRGHEYSLQMWFQTIKKRPALLKAPIALYKDKVIVCNTPTDILKFG